MLGVCGACYYQVLSEDFIVLKDSKRVISMSILPQYVAGSWIVGCWHVPGRCGD